MLLISRRCLARNLARRSARALSAAARPRTYEELAAAGAVDSQLARDVLYLGRTLGEAVQKEDPLTFAAVEKLRRAARAWRDEGGAEGSEHFDSIVSTVHALPPKQLRDTARAFAHFLALCNGAEAHHRLRRLNSVPPPPRAPSAADALPYKEDSCVGTLDAIVHDDGGSYEAALQALSTQRVEIVLTAHPTEVHRRTLLTKHRRVTELLARRDALVAGSSNQYAAAEIERRLRAEISSMWGSDELRRAKPTPELEARGGLAVLETALWDAVPGFLRRLDAGVAARCGGAHLPLTARPITFASWMGGDRDGNPNVVADVTRRVVAKQRRRMATLLLAEFDELRLELSVRECTSDLRALATGSCSAQPESPESREPYKAIVEALSLRLRATRDWANATLHSESAGRDPRAAAFDAEPLFNTSELQRTLVTMHESLVACGYAELADGRLVDTIRRVGAFGLQLAPLDLRQESDRHTAAVDALCRVAGLPSYTERSEKSKVEFLSTELAAKRPLLPRGAFARLGALGVSKDEEEVLETAELVATLPPGSLGAYVISQATHASDVLAVELLMAESGARNPLRVVPLFETLDDLNGAAATLDALFSSPGYAKRSGSTQEVMVGYSDSAKDAGRLAASWAQFEAQEAMQEVASKHGFDLSFFHGKGGTVGRGGNPKIYEAVLSHPEGTIGGNFRVTEQGEMIQYNFGSAAIAERTLDTFTAGVLRDGFKKRPAPTSEWRAAMAELSRVSCDGYRRLVRERKEFVRYFRSVTPELELGELNVGSRPAKRNPQGGVESLRAIPWIFAWAQTRMNVPAWLGVSDALGPTSPVDQKDLRSMYEEWGWFKTNIDLVAMLLAKSEVNIGAHYENTLAGDDAGLKEIGDELRTALASTEDAVLAISGSDALAEDSHVVQRALRLRNPYVDVLNVCQAEALRRLRDERLLGDPGYEAEATRDALLVTINGISTGLQNSG